MPPLSREAVARVLGPVDDNTAAELVATGSTEQELREAHAWLNEDEALVGELRPLPSGRVAELVEILRPVEGLDDEEE